MELTLTHGTHTEPVVLVKKKIIGYTSRLLIESKYGHRTGTLWRPTRNWAANAAMWVPRRRLNPTV